MVGAAGFEPVKADTDKVRKQSETIMQHNGQIANFSYENSGEANATVGNIQETIRTEQNNTLTPKLQKSFKRDDGEQQVFNPPPDISGAWPLMTPAERQAVAEIIDRAKSRR